MSISNLFNKLLSVFSYSSKTTSSDQNKQSKDKAAEKNSHFSEKAKTVKKVTAKKSNSKKPSKVYRKKPIPSADNR